MTLLPITTINNDVLAIDSRIIANGLGINHSNFLETVKTYQSVIEKDFERVPFETETLKTKGGNQQVKFALLTHDQIAFIAMLSRNTPKVVEFKSLIVQSFSHAKKQLQATRQALMPLQAETGQATNGSQTDDNVILGYMVFLREKSQGVTSFDDAIKLQEDFANFLNEYKTILDEDKSLQQRRAKLLSERKAKLKPSPTTSDTSNGSKSKPSLPSRNSITLTSQETETLTKFIEKYSSSITPTRESYHSRKPKNKAPFSTSLSEFENECKSSGIAYTANAIESILESLGWKREIKFPDRWVTYF